jgi:SAM-dependent methyltransferase
VWCRWCRGSPSGSIEAGIDVADVGCGQGHAINVLARAFPASRFTELDRSEQGIDSARAEAKEWGLGNTTFEVRDIATLQGAIDLVTGFDIVHDQAKPMEVLRAIRRSLREGGTFLCADIAMQSALADNLEYPLGPWFYTFSLMHCMTVSLAEGGGPGHDLGRADRAQVLRGSRLPRRTRGTRRGRSGDRVLRPHARRGVTFARAPFRGPERQDTGLWSRLEGFRPEDLAQLVLDRKVLADRGSTWASRTASAARRGRSLRHRRRTEALTLGAR